MAARGIQHRFSKEGTPSVLPVFGAAITIELTMKEAAEETGESAGRRSQPSKNDAELDQFSVIHQADLSSSRLLVTASSPHLSKSSCESN